MSSLKSKSDSELKEMVDESYGKFNPQMPEIVKELFSRDIFYKSPQEIKNKKELNKMTEEMWGKKHPFSSMYKISQKTFIEEASKLIPEWNLEIIPNDFVEIPEKYEKVTAILKNKQFSKIVQECSISLTSRKSPWHFSKLYTIIATARYKDESEKYEKLLDEIALHFSNFFMERKNNLEICSKN